MVSALAPKPRFVPSPSAPSSPPVAKPPLRLVPTLPEPPPTLPRAGFGGVLGGAAFTISALWAGKGAYDAVKAVPSQLPWMPGKPVDPTIWSDPKRVQVEARVRFGNMDSGHLSTLKFVREKQSMPVRRDPMYSPHDRNLFVQDENGEWVQIPLEGQQSGALEIGTLWEHGLPGKPMHERATDELKLIEFELGRRNFQVEESKADADNSWFEQYIKYIHDLAEALRKRANGENVPLPILVIDMPEEKKMGPQNKMQSQCSAQNSNATSDASPVSTAAAEKAGGADLEKIQKTGVLRIGTSGDYFPFSFKDAEGNLAGVDIELGKLLAVALGVRAEFVLFRWQEWTRDMLEDRFDIAMSGITVTAERLQKMAFSSSYLQSGAVPMARQTANVKDVDTLNTPDVRLVVNRGGYLEGVARRTFPQAQIITTTENTRLGEFVASDQADVLLTDSLEALAIALRYPELVAISRITSDQHAYALPQGNVGIRAKLNQLLVEVQKSGFLAKLLGQYGVQD